MLVLFKGIYVSLHPAITERFIKIMQNKPYQSLKVSDEKKSNFLNKKFVV